MIPNIMHQIWTQGYDKIPPELKNYYTTCAKINSDFQHIFWDEEKIRAFLKTYYKPQFIEFYDACTYKAQKADVARYAILYIYGGIYLDMDTVCRKNLSPFLKYDFFVTGNIMSKILRRYLNGIIGARPRHPLFLVIFKNMFDRKAHLDDVLYSTGPKLLYASIEEYKKITNKNDISIVDTKYLYPCAIHNDSNCPSTCKDCYIAHTSYVSWSPGLRCAKHIFKNLELVLAILTIIIILIIICRRN